MPFDADLTLCDGSADWSYANLVTSNYGTPTSTTRNSGGFVVLDMQSYPYSGIDVVLLFIDAANADTDALTVIIQESDVEAFSSDVHTLGGFDIAAATTGIILGSEITSTDIPVDVHLRITPSRRYLRIDASCTSADDFGTVYCYVTPFPYKKL